MMNGNLNEAIDTLNKALELEPEHDYALGNLAICYVRADKLDQAFEILKKYIKLAHINREKVRVTKDFENIQNHPEFIKLINGE